MPKTDVETTALRLRFTKEIGFHAREKQEKQDADLRDGIEHALQRRRAGKDYLSELWHQGAKDRWAEKDAREELSKDGRLAGAAHDFAQRPAEEQQ